MLKGLTSRRAFLRNTAMATAAGVAGYIVGRTSHGSQFSAVNGAVIQGPATRPLPPVAIAVRDGYVYT